MPSKGFEDEGKKPQKRDASRNVSDSSTDSNDSKDSNSRVKSPSSVSSPETSPYKKTTYRGTLPSIDQLLLNGPNSMAETSPKLHPTGGSPDIPFASDPHVLNPGNFINTDLRNWKRLVHAQIDEYQGERSLTCQQFTVPCNTKSFSEILDCKLPGTKIDYVRGLAEITVYSATHVHNSVGGFDWRTWMRSLPGQEDLHHDQHEPGLLNLLHQTVDATITYTEGDADDDDVRRAPDLQLGSYLGSRPLIGRIIFEVAYSESLVHARRKAKYYLCEADQPRPSVMVLCNFTETARKKEFGEERRDMKLYFEVLRCDFSNQSETRKYETGYAWPEAKAAAPANTADITFSIQEIIGSVKVIDDAIHLQEHPEENSYGMLKKALSQIPNGLLELLKGKAERHEHVKHPISYITDAVEAGLDLQLQEDKKHENDTVDLSPEQVRFQ